MRTPSTSQRVCLTVSRTDVIPLQKIMHDILEEVRVWHRPPPAPPLVLRCVACDRIIRVPQAIRQAAASI
jgi:hypothetical protein